MARKAMTTEEKSTRVDKILDTASALMLDTHYQHIKIADISETLNISQGSIYNYFSSKESIFLHLYIRELNVRADRFKTYLNEHPIESYDDFYNVIMTEFKTTLDESPLYVRLSSIKSTVLEKNVDVHEVVEVRDYISDLLDKVSASLSCWENCPTPADIRQMLYAQSAIMVGTYVIFCLDPIIEQAAIANDLEIIKVNQRRVTVEAFKTYLDGMSKG